MLQKENTRGRRDRGRLSGEETMENRRMEGGESNNLDVINRVELAITLFC